MNPFTDPDSLQSGVAVVIERDAEDVDIMIAVWPQDVVSVLNALRSIIEELENFQSDGRTLN